MSNTRKKKTGNTSSGRKTRTSSAKSGRKKSVSRGTAEQRQENSDKKAFLLREAGFIFLLFAALFLLIANFGILGSVGEAVSGFQKGLYGYNAYLFPFVIVFFVFYFAKERRGFLFWFKIFSVVLLFTVVCAMLHLAFGTKVPHSFSEYFEAGKNGKLFGLAAGGAVGGFIGDALRKSIASAGAWLLLIALFLLSVVVISEKSIVNFAKRRAEKASELAHNGTAFARERMHESRIRHEARKEAAELRRKEEAMERDLRAADTVPPALFPDYLGEFADPVTGRDDICLSGGKTPEQPAEIQTEQEPAKAADPEPDYYVDEVPFAETPEDRYKAYGKILSGGNLDVVSAERMGFAVSRNTETYRNPYEQHAQETSSSDSRGSADSNAGIPEELPAFSDFENIQDIPESGKEDTGFLDEGYVERESQETQTSSFTGPVTGYDDFYNITDEQRDSVYDERKKAAAKDTAVTSFSHDRKEAEAAKKAEGQTAENEKNERTAEPAPQKPVRKRPYQFPPVSLLNRGSRAVIGNQSMNRENARKLEMVLANFGVKVTVTNIVKGPRVTRYEMTPDEGVRVSKITSLAGDIKLALAASDLRIEAPIPGKSAVGIEVPNSESSTVTFRDIMETEEFKNARSHLAWGVGLDIQGAPIVGDIAKMPHLLVSGTTGSGKSVGINSIIMSVIYRAKPEDVKLILVDPKVVELSVYDGIPHLLAPVVTKPDKALAVLNKACAEMEDRYRLFKESNTRNIIGYNEKIEEICAKLPEGMEKPQKLPYILIIIDELSELMMHSKRDVESAIVSLTQLARAAGIHLVVATQRPSVDVVTGLIKSNIPSRVAYRLPSGIDSRTILDTFGAETLLGNGDMLYKPGNVNNPIRVQGAYLSDAEVEQVVDWLKKHNSVFYEDEWENVKAPEPSDNGSFREGGEAADDGRDEYFVEAGILITEKKKASIGALQRKFKVGFNRASRIMEQLNEAGVVSEGEGTKERTILMSPEEFRERFGNG